MLLMARVLARQCGEIVVTLVATRHSAYRSSRYLCCGETAIRAGTVFDKTAPPTARRRDMAGGSNPQ